ncbi:MAG: MBL fold metallo-hydrolase [Armatimonadota bacterium]
MIFEIHNIRQDKPIAGNVLIYWLGAAGFAFKFASGEIVCIDPYLSDYVERMFGFRRLTLPPLKADDLRFDTLLITHEHGDHLDIDSFDMMMAVNPGCRVVAPPSCEGFLMDEHADYIIASPGISLTTNQICIDVVDADHGPECPDAVGYLISFNERKIYFTGDTGYDFEILSEAISVKPDIVIPCINGAYGNLMDDEAVDLAIECSARVAIPSHFWLFAEHGIGSPGVFRDRMKEKAEKVEVILLTPGRGVEV